MAETEQSTETEAKPAADTAKADTAKAEPKKNPFLTDAEAPKAEPKAEAPKEQPKPEVDLSILQDLYVKDSDRLDKEKVALKIKSIFEEKERIKRTLSKGNETFENANDYINKVNVKREIVEKVAQNPGLQQEVIKLAALAVQTQLSTGQFSMVIENAVNSYNPSETKVQTPDDLIPDERKKVIMDDFKKTTAELANIIDDIGPDLPIDFKKSLDHTIKSIQTYETAEKFIGIAKNFSTALTALKVKNIAPVARPFNVVSNDVNASTPTLTKKEIETQMTQARLRGDYETMNKLAQYYVSRSKK
jgi:hypothetical protein